MSTKHTPGKWKSVAWSAGEDGVRRAVETDDGNFTICGGGIDPTPGDAALIAAAPEMLVALTWVRDHCTGLPAVARALAEKAIAKAEGR